MAASVWPELSKTLRILRLLRSEISLLDPQKIDVCPGFSNNVIIPVLREGGKDPLSKKTFDTSQIRVLV